MVLFPPKVVAQFLSGDNVSLALTCIGVWPRRCRTYVRGHTQCYKSKKDSGISAADNVPWFWWYIFSFNKDHNIHITQYHNMRKVYWEFGGFYHLDVTNVMCSIG